MTLQDIKQRFGIIGSNAILDRAIDIANQVAPTDLNVLINGESGTGKEVFPQIIHQNSVRKHGQYIAVNCGAIPEGTIDSELFGHEKGSFTGAHEARKGYFEVADGGTIFLDEVGELPLSTQARLLRVLESGEYMKVGSSKVQKTNVRVVAATNINFIISIEKGKFREDLFYRLNTVPINLPPLRDRKDDIALLFRKFANDFATKYRMPPVKLNPNAEQALINYYWPGNIRQLKNITEQISIIEKEREISLECLLQYLPNYQINKLPALSNNIVSGSSTSDMSERDLLYKVLIEMKKELNDLKQVVQNIMNGSPTKLGNISSEEIQNIERLYNANDHFQVVSNNGDVTIHNPLVVKDNNGYTQPIVVEESLSLQDKEIDLIKKALKKHKGKRKYASQELGISERTLYRKINEYNIQE
ncbi:MAG: sigma-54 interaction domain-containing protein [Bacteroidota bacterium]|jgi:transcriptional regulator with PAS, ATPase and Fis domain